MYFQEFPKLNYNFQIGDTKLNNVEVLDVFRRVFFNIKISPINRRPTTAYIPEAGDTAEIIAEKFYGDPEYWWLVCLFTNTVNPFNAFPRSGLDAIENPNANVDAYMYLEQQGGVEQRGVKKGDYIAVGSGSTTIPYQDPRGRYYSSAETVPELKKIDGVNIILRVVSWDSTLLKAGVVGDVSNVNVGDRYIIMENYDDAKTVSQPNILIPDASFISSWGKILRKETQGQNTLTGFTDGRTGFPVSPLTDIGSRNLSSIYKKDKNNIFQGHTFGNTIVGGFLGTEGNSGSTYAERYVPEFEMLQAQETTDELGPTARPPRILKLLNAEFKDEALLLFKESIRGVRNARRTFSSFPKNRSQGSSSSGNY